MENANDNFNIINGKDNGDHKEGLEKFKALLQKIKEYGTGVRTPKPKKILIATDADACLFCGDVSHYAGAVGLGIMSDMVYVYRNIFKLCDEAGIKCDFCLLTKLQPYACNPFFKEQLSERLGKDKDEQSFIKPEDIKFAPYYGGGKTDIDHENFNKKMFGVDNGYEDTEVLYFDNDLGNKIKSFKVNFNNNLKSKGLKDRIKFPANIIHTEDVKNWITDTKDKEEIVKKQLGKDWDNILDKKCDKETYIKYKFIGLPNFEQKTSRYGFDFNQDGLMVSDLLRATQEVLFEKEPLLKMKQNYWIAQNFEKDKKLANKLFENHSSELKQLKKQTEEECATGAKYDDVYNKLAIDTTEKIRKDPVIKVFSSRYRPNPVSEASADRTTQGGKKGLRKKIWLGSEGTDKRYEDNPKNSVFEWIGDDGKVNKYVTLNPKNEEYRDGGYTWRKSSNGKNPAFYVDQVNGVNYKIFWK